MRAIEHLLLLRLLSSAFADGKIFDLKKSLKSFNLIQLNCLVVRSWKLNEKEASVNFLFLKKVTNFRNFFWSNRWNNCCFQENNFLMWNLFFAAAKTKTNRLLASVWFLLTHLCWFCFHWILQELAPRDTPCVHQLNLSLTGAIWSWFWKNDSV